MISALYQNKWMQQYYFRRPEMEKLLVRSVLFSCFLLIVRVALTGRLLFVFLPWNLFLAWVPYFIVREAAQRPRWTRHLGRFSLLFATWLLFLPNSFYILTDLFHLELREESNQWFDLTLIFSFAWNGILLGILSMREMEKILRLSFGMKNEFFFLWPVMWLNALGIYIGRFLRFNSWDVVTNPFALMGEIGYMLAHPFRHAGIWAMIACFAVFMTLIYSSIKNLAKQM